MLNFFKIIKHKMMNFFKIIKYKIPIFSKHMTTNCKISRVIKYKMSN